MGLTAASAGRRLSPLEALDDLLTSGLGSIESAEVLRVEARRYAATMREGIEQLLELAVAAGELAVGEPELDCGRLAAAVDCTYNGVLVTWALTPRGPLPEWVRHQVGVLLRPYQAAARA